MSSAVGAYVGDLGSYDVNMGSYDVDMGVYPGKDFLCTSAAISARRSARRKRSVGFFLPCIGLSGVSSYPARQEENTRDAHSARTQRKTFPQAPGPGLTTHNSEVVVVVVVNSAKCALRMLSEKWKWTKKRYPARKDNDKTKRQL